jgi:hypothetical protein
VTVIVGEQQETQRDYLGEKFAVMGAGIEDIFASMNLNYRCLTKKDVISSTGRS